MLLISVSNLDGLLYSCGDLRVIFSALLEVADAGEVGHAGCVDVVLAMDAGKPRISRTQAVIILIYTCTEAWLDFTVGVTDGTG